MLNTRIHCTSGILRKEAKLINKNKYLALQK